MARLNKKSTKNAIIKVLKDFGCANPIDEKDPEQADVAGIEWALLSLAHELEIEIKPEDYKA